MLNKLKQRWKVNDVNLVLIICTFALGGSLCGWLGKKLISFTSIEKGAGWIVLYIVVVCLLWPFCVLLVSIPLGQFFFFKNYLSKVGGKISGRQKPVISIAIFASGTGSNAQKIIAQFKNDTSIKIALIVCNKPGAGVLSIAARENIPSLIIERKKFEADGYLTELKNYKIDFIVLAGFLWKMPAVLIQVYPDKIINIHPALLPKYGGKGMYGSRVHEAVINAKEKESGISIHYVDEIYDHGRIIFQATCTVDENDSPDTLAKKIHELEHRHYTAVISSLLQIPK